jgi:hypothetical protein
MADLKLDDLRAGDTVIADDGFTCLPAGAHVVHGDGDGLFIFCNGPDDDPDPTSHHYLDGQQNKDGSLVGISRPKVEG